MVTDSEEPHPSLSDWHDYEPQLEFDDTELTHAPESSKTNQHVLPLRFFFIIFVYFSFFFSYNQQSFVVLIVKTTFQTKWQVLVWKTMSLLPVSHY